MADAAIDTQGDVLAVTEHWVTLSNGEAYHYARAGEIGRPVLIFLHGYTDSWRSVAPIIAKLANSHLVLALDQRGHGDTGHKFDSYRLADFAEDAAEFIETLGVSEVTLIGHSLGSLVAQRVAAERPDLVAKLVLIGSADTASGNDALVGLQAEVATLTDPVPADFALAFQASTVFQPIGDDDLAAFAQESRRVPLPVWKAVAAELAANNEVVAQDVTVPTLILWGDRDGIFNLQAQQRLERGIANARLIAYHEVGHAPHWERPLAVAQDIATFAVAGV